MLFVPDSPLAHPQKMSQRGLSTDQRHPVIYSRHAEDEKDPLSPALSSSSSSSLPSSEPSTSSQSISASSESTSCSIPSSSSSSSSASFLPPTSNRQPHRGLCHSPRRHRSHYNSDPAATDPHIPNLHPSQLFGGILGGHTLVVVLVPTESLEESMSGSASSRRRGPPSRDRACRASFGLRWGGRCEAGVVEVEPFARAARVVAGDHGAVGGAEAVAVFVVLRGGSRRWRSEWVLLLTLSARDGEGWFAGALLCEGSSWCFAERGLEVFDPGDFGRYDGFEDERFRTCEIDPCGPGLRFERLDRLRIDRKSSSRGRFFRYCSSRIAGSVYEIQRVIDMCCRLQLKPCSHA